jgi:hypothetical protein
MAPQARDTTNGNGGRSSDRALIGGAIDAAAADPAVTDPAVADEVGGVVRAAVDAVGRAGTISVSAVTDALESAGRSLSGRVVTGAATEGKDLADPNALERSLAAKPRIPALGSATTAALALRFATRFRSLGFLARRTPAYLVAAAIPALIASVTRGADELGMVASHLVHRARAEGVEPDLERVRRVAVQIVARRPVDPEVEPSHGALAVQWLRRAFRAALPFTAGVATADPEGLARAAAEVDTSRLGAT